MPKNRGSHKNRKKQQSSANHTHTHSSRSTKDESQEPITDGQGTGGREGAGFAVDAATAMRPEEEMNRHEEVMAVFQDYKQHHPPDDVYGDLQEEWLENLPELTELTLWKISEFILPLQFMPLGLKLGLPQRKVQILLDESTRVCQQEEKTFKMLYTWYANQGEDPSKFLFQVLTSDEDPGLDPEQVFKLFSERQFKGTGFCGRYFQSLQLQDIAEEVHVDKLIPLGLRLGLTYARISSIRVDSDGHSVDARYNILIQWQKEQTAQIDQFEILARVMEACHHGKIAYKIRQNHLGVTNEGKTLLISEEQQMEGVAEVQLNVTHSNKMVREETQGHLQALLDAGSSEVSLVGPQAEVAEFLQDLKMFSIFLKRHSDTVKNLEKCMGRDGLYKLIGLSLESIHFHVKVYTIEGLHCLQRDVQSGRIGRQLAEVLTSAETKLQFPEDIVLDVSPEGSGAWDLLSHVDIDVLPSTSPSADSEKKEDAKDDKTVSSGPISREDDVQEVTLGKHIAAHQGRNANLQAVSSTPETPNEIISIASNVPLRQGEASSPDNAVDKENDPGTTTDTKLAGEASKKMEYWSEGEVTLWLRNVVHLSEELVSKFVGVDGFTLVRCTKAELKEDFGLSAGYCIRLVLRREDYLEKERMGVVTTLEYLSLDSRDGSSKVSAPESADTPSPVTVEPCQLEADEPVVEEESMQEAFSPSPLSNIDQRDAEAQGKKSINTASSEVPCASAETERDAAESSVDMDTGYTSSYTSAARNPSEVDLPLSALGHAECKKSLYQETEMGGMVSDSNTEKKLTNLLLGSDKGELDSSYYPVLVVNTPAKQWSSAELEEKFGFMSSVKWNVVFDCNADSNEVGLCQYVNQRKSIKILSAETFTETKDIDVLREGIDFPEVPVWVFPNGRNDVNVKGMDKKSDMDWMRERSHAVLNTVRFFSDPGVIPTGRAVVVFLLLSDSDFMVMTQLFREFYTSKSFQDLRRFTIIAENQGVLHRWIQQLDIQSIVASKNMRYRCLGGVPWQEINTYMMRLLGSCQTHLPELPMFPKGQCQLMKKHQSQWSDISILAKNECENTSMDESNPNFSDFVQEKESQFYQGHEVDWWNFYLSEKRLNEGKRYDQVLKRQNYNKFYSDVQKVLASLGKKMTHISMATVFHEAGSGGTTVAKNLLWDLHRDYRCAVVNRVTNDTVNQIVAFQKYGYEEGQNPGPVVILLENLDSESMLRPFLMSLERETSYIENNGLAFVLIHCKRTSEPQRLQKKEEPKPCVCIQHKLTDKEQHWFTKKTKDLENRNVFSEQESPELLLAFMVMKKECDPEYLKKVVKGILPRVCKDSKKPLLNGVNLLKYIAVVRKYNPIFAMPVSACDGFMQNRYRIMTSGGRQQTYEPWEKNRLPFLNLLLLEEFIQDIDGCVKGLKIVHSIIATEIVDQLGELFQQTPADMILELLEKSTILDTLSYSRGYIQKVCRDLMVRRLKKEYGDDRETDFAPFIEDVYVEDKAKAFKIMEVGIQKFQDPFIAQQKARLHSKREDDPDKAEQAINIALGIVSKNSYLWDTKGIILRQKMTKYERKEVQEAITDCEMKELLDTFNESCGAFQNAQKVMEEETTRRNYAGFVGEITTIAKFLEIVQKRVKPFCYRNTGLETLRRYLMTEYVPHELTLPSLREFSDTMKSLSERVDKALGRFTDYLVHCAHQRFGKATYRIFDVKLEKIFNARHRYFTLSSPNPSEVHAQYPVETVYAMRRAEVKRMNADGYQQIFEMASKNKVADLKHAQDLLRLNLASPSLFDIKNFVFTVFALSVCSNEGLDEEVARKSVNILKVMEEKDNGFYGLFFEMLLNWPDGTPREGSTPITETIRQLRARWNDRYRNKGYEDSPHNLPKRSKIRPQNSSLKPTTEFYLGLQERKSRFVHRKSIGRVTYDIWKEESIKKRLQRLDGVLDSKHFVLYNPDREDPVKIILSLPIKGLPSQEPVQFYLGFSFAGPLAYDVIYKDNRETPFIAKESSSNYPSYVNQLDDIDEGPAHSDF